MVSCQHLMIERDDRMLGTLLLYQLLKINVSQTDSKQIKFYILQGRCVDVALLAKFLYLNSTHGYNLRQHRVHAVLFQP